MKTLHCADAGFTCEGIIKAETEDEVLRQAAQHVREVHDAEVTPEMAEKLKSLIKDDEN